MNSNHHKDGGAPSLSDGSVQSIEELAQQGNHELGSYMGHGHQTVDRLSGYLRDAQVEELAGDVQGYARGNPNLSVGTLFAAGFLAGRFRRSWVPKSSTGARPARLNGQPTWR